MSSTSSSPAAVAAVAATTADDSGNANAISMRLSSASDDVTKTKSNNNNNDKTLHHTPTLLHFHQPNQPKPLFPATFCVRALSFRCLPAFLRRLLLVCLSAFFLAFFFLTSALLWLWFDCELARGATTAIAITTANKVPKHSTNWQPSGQTIKRAFNQSNRIAVKFLLKRL